MLAGMIAGAALLAGPAYLRLHFGVDEVVTTLLLNFIVILFVGLMIEGPLRDPLAFGWPQSVPVSDDYRLPDLVPRTRLHIGLLFAVAAAAAIWLVLARTVFGSETRAAGLNADAAAFAGVSLPKTIMGVALLSGALAGLAGSIEVMGVTAGVTTTMSPGFGYAGIVVAMLKAADIVGQQDVDAREAQTLQIVLEGAHDPIIAVVVNHVERQGIDHAKVAGVFHGTGLQETSNLVRQNVVAASQNIADDPFGSSEPVPRGRIKVSDARVFRGLDKFLGLCVSEIDKVSAERSPTQSKRIYP
jgi:ABC-type uncharacterized transport system permease subunit